jgi:putative acetyltransferase
LQASKSEAAIRRGTIGDAEEILEIYRSSVRGIACSCYTPEQVDAWAGENRFGLEHIQTHLTQLEFYVASQGDRAVGFVSLDLPNRVLEHIFVRPEVHGAGVGAALMRFAIARARELGFDSLRLVASLNARPFYEHFEFVLDEHIVKVVDGVEMPCSKMTLQLAQVP